MLRALFLFMAGFALAELISLLLAARWIGVLPVLMLLLAAAFAGFWLISGSRVRLDALKNGQPSLAQVAESTAWGISGVVAGILLIIPGFVSDFLALSMVLPPVRNSMSVRFAQWVPKPPAGPPAGIVIDAEGHEIFHENTISGGSDQTR
jgi:UPF0716 protein FxsA